MNKLIKLFFKNRGYGSNEEEINDYIENLNKVQEYNLSLLNKYVEYLHACKNQSIVVLTDFDTDGIMAGTIGYAALKELGFKVNLYNPDTSRGYGFTKWDIERIEEQYDPEVILTGDVGVTAYEAVEYARSKGIKMFVTDHHTCPEVLPDADMLLNPKAFKFGFSYRDICGATVMWYLMHSYAKAYGTEEQLSYVDALKIFTGFSTISDSMPVFSENRGYVRDTVKVLREIYKDRKYKYHDGEIFTRLNLMVETFVEAGKIRTISDIDEDFFGFYVAPTLNSLKRMGGDIAHAYNIFFAERDEAKASLLFLIDLSRQRKELVESKFEELKTTEQPYKPYLYITDAHGGVCGLLAQKVMEETGYPALVVHETETGDYSGSGRSYEWFPFLEFAKDRDFFAAGHNEAFGTRIDKDKMQYVFEEMSREVPLKEPEDRSVKPDFVISTLNDGDTNVDIPLFEEFVKELETIKPFGQGFPAPQFEFRFERDKARCFKMGKNKEHTKYIVNGIPVIFFFSGEKTFPAVISVRGMFSINEYKGVKSLQLIA